MRADRAAAPITTTAIRNRASKIKPTSSGSLNLADLSINAAVIALLVGLALDWYRQRRDQRDGDTPPLTSGGRS